MEMTDAIKRLSAIAQDARLDVFRLLVKVGPEGMAAGEIARKLGIQANTLSAQLLVLSNARLVHARREGRSIIYSINFEAMSELLIFLTEDCCAGRSEVCAPLAVVANRCCTPSKTRSTAPSRSSDRVQKRRKA
jgi:DNA-binding transcriptional ArsR family regulator